MVIKVYYTSGGNFSIGDIVRFNDFGELVKTDPSDGLEVLGCVVGHDPELNVADIDRNYYEYVDQQPSTTNSRGVKNCPKKYQYSINRPRRPTRRYRQVNGYYKVVTLSETELSASARDSVTDLYTIIQEKIKSLFDVEIPRSWIKKAVVHFSMNGSKLAIPFAMPHIKENAIIDYVSKIIIIRDEIIFPSIDELEISPPVPNFINNNTLCTMTGRTLYNCRCQVLPDIHQIKKTAYQPDHELGSNNQKSPVVASTIDDDKKKLREDVKRNLGIKDKEEVTYICLDKLFSPFKTGCNCGAEFNSFTGLQAHVKQKTGRLPNMAARYFVKGVSIFDIE